MCECRVELIEKQSLRRENSAETTHYGAGVQIIIRDLNIFSKMNLPTVNKI